MTPPAASSTTVLRAVGPARLYPCVVRTDDFEGSVLVLGERATAYELERLADDTDNGARRVRVTALDGAILTEDGTLGHNLRRFVAEQEIATIVVADPTVEGDPELVEALMECKSRGVRIRDGVGLYEDLFRKIRLDILSPSTLLYSRNLVSTRLFQIAKRAFDLVAGIVLLLLLAPVMAAVALAVRLDSRGPVFFVQERVGRRGEPFRIVKFRSMRTDAEKEGPVWARADDDRVTRIGGFLRKTHLDELPQLFNVLRGDMSLVGPRPERPCFVEMLRRRIPYYDLRHHVTPGVTGWAQVEYEYGDSIEDSYRKLEYDLYYAMHASPWLDLKILLMTVHSVINGKGR